MADDDDGDGEILEKAKLFSIYLIYLAMDLPPVTFAVFLTAKSFW
jgi:hypothetical protein